MTGSGKLGLMGLALLCACDSFAGGVAAQSVQIENCDGFVAVGDLVLPDAAPEWSEEWLWTADSVEHSCIWGYPGSTATQSDLDSRVRNMGAHGFELQREDPDWVAQNADDGTRVTAHLYPEPVGPHLSWRRTFEGDASKRASALERGRAFARRLPPRFGEFLDTQAADAKMVKVTVEAFAELEAYSMRVTASEHQGAATPVTRLESKDIAPSEFGLGVEEMPRGYSYTVDPQGRVALAFVAPRKLEPAVGR